MSAARSESSGQQAVLPRLLAVRLLAKVLKKSLPFDQALTHAGATPFVHELLYGVLRHYFSLSQLVSQHMQRPLRKKDFDLQCLLLTGALQIHFMRTPGHAAVHESVEIARRLGKPWADKLINAVLRAIAAGKLVPEGLAAQFDHPAWLIEQVRAHYPDSWREMLSANLTRAPMFLRVNATRTSREAALEALLEQGIPATPGALPACIVLSEPVPSERIPGIAAGQLSIQDQGAQLAAALLSPRPGMRVLDACAAPGNKATHLLESSPEILLTCVDISEARLRRVGSECERLGLPRPVTVCARFEDLDWWDGRAFDAVLLDVPCSGTGTLRRHPDIKVLARPEDIEGHHRNQLRLIDAAWRTLKPGGKLLYSTCSIWKRENEDSAQALRTQGDALLLALPEIKASGLPHVETRCGAQLVTTPQGTDAMYYALFEKHHAMAIGPEMAGQGS